MSNEVYANMMEVSCKAANGKSICAMPDVCMTPPQTPATPPGVPVPYPNTGMASDCTDGSSTVTISNQPVMLKDQSGFKKSTGDEAGSAPMKGVITATNTGKVYFVAWSMDVQVEGENVVRNLDLTIHNSNSCPANTPPQAYIDAASKGLPPKACAKEIEKIEEECNKNKGDPCPGALSTPKKPTSEFADQATKDAQGACAKAVKCFLRPYKTDGENSCCDGQTGHHIPPWSTTDSIANSTSGLKKDTALCVCVEGTSHSIGSHGKNHHGINYLLGALEEETEMFSAAKVGKYNMYSGKLADHVSVASQVTAAQSDCSKECIEEQLKSQFSDDDLQKTATHNASTTGGESYGMLNEADQSALDAVAKEMAAPPAPPFGP